MTSRRVGSHFARARSAICYSKSGTNRSARLPAPASSDFGEIVIGGLPARRSESDTAGFIRCDGKGDAQNETPRYRPGTAAAEDAAPPGTPVPGRRAIPGREQAQTGRHPAPRPAHRGLRGRLLLALVPEARPPPEEQPGVVAAQARRRGATRPGHGLRAHHSRLARRARGSTKIPKPPRT